MVLDILAIVLSSLAILSAIIGAAWKLSSRLTKLESKLDVHNGSIDTLTAEVKAACQQIEHHIIRKE